MPEQSQALHLAQFDGWRWPFGVRRCGVPHPRRHASEELHQELRGSIAEESVSQSVRLAGAELGDDGGSACVAERDIMSEEAEEEAAEAEKKKARWRSRVAD